ncbi:MAG: hypothetical protein RL226_1342, partial [Bacteroidota bacterium]
MNYFTPDFIAFFSELKENNHRDWFTDNKKRYEKSVKDPFSQFVGALIAEMNKSGAAIGLQPKDAIFRINRDVRFSKNKEPYKTHTSAVLSAGGRKEKELPGFYVQLSSDTVWFGGGAYFLEKENLFMVREYIAMHPDRYLSIINNSAFKKLYGSVLGEKNKIVPAEFKAVVDKVPDIANKQFYYMAELNADVLL